MKRFFGTIMAIAGAAGTLWGGFYCISGGTERLLDPLPINAMNAGLVGITCLIFGLVWIRD